MIKIGEKLNSSIPSTLEAMKNADAARLKELITLQSGAGADFLDINTALCDNELEMQKLLIELTLQNSQ